MRQMLLVRCKPWSNDPPATHRILVEGVDVRVWDPVTREFTLRHSLSPQDRRTIQAEVLRTVGR